MVPLFFKAEMCDVKFSDMQKCIHIKVSSCILIWAKRNGSNSKPLV